MHGLLNLRPARRLVAIEASGAVFYAAVTLPFIPLDAPQVPDWVSLSGLALLLFVIALNLHTWRLVVTSGLALHGSGPPVHSAGRLPDQLHDERRLRWVAVLYLALTIVLLPVPATWVMFWFSFTLATACLAGLSLIAFACNSMRRTRGAGEAL
ncbi:membrane hypothetical protein [Rhodococcus sp. RD6.2]|uniref:hypothetical protein n=1 Tax=Rhodococcus sp. RD6.2 TaxID=260936 RepID=UPI00063B5FD0|nr:hypothetical protein [Rhodococcus sp. RD6.2]CRK52163.1 membrane hypothetical protein [Rhodococcus sp. RD6.2]